MNDGDRKGAAAAILEHEHVGDKIVHDIIRHLSRSFITPIDREGVVETAAASVIQAATHFGVPVSTTHTITAAIMGVGSSQRLSAVRWGVAGSIVTAWVLTLPAAGLVGAGVYLAGEAIRSIL
jgi:PiT family inorganic phosphate transporter